MKGRYISATCSAKYDQDKSKSDDVTVKSFSGSNLITVAETGNFGVKWNKINTSEEKECCFVKDYVTSDPDPYKSTYKNDESYQYCSIAIPLYSS